MLWAYAGTRRLIWWFLILGPLEAVVFSVQASLVGPHQILTGPDLAHKLQRNGYVEIALLVAAYIAFVSFFNRTATASMYRGKCCNHSQGMRAMNPL